MTNLYNIAINTMFYFADIVYERIKVKYDKDQHHKELLEKYSEINQKHSIEKSDEY